MDDDTPRGPGRVAWIDDFASGHAAIDAQHRELLALCDALAALSGDADAPRFDAAFQQFQSLVRRHFEAEAALLAGEAARDDHAAEAEEFAYLADEIATTANFDRLELQRFVAVWCLGHVTASARQLRESS